MKYCLGGLFFLALSLIEAHDGCMFWSLYTYGLGLLMLWHWGSTLPVKWLVKRASYAKALYYAEVESKEE